MGTEDVKVTAMNMYKYKEGLCFNNRWPCSTLHLNSCLKQNDRGKLKTELAPAILSHIVTFQIH